MGLYATEHSSSSRRWRRGAGALGGAALLALALSGCEEDACSRGASECVSASLLRTCVPGDDGPEWFVSACGEGAQCSASGAANVDGGSGGGRGAGAACVGTCAAGSSECVGDEAARYCVDGRAWQLEACGAGQRCVEGVCRFADGGVELCRAGARQCGTDQVEKVCDRDGSKWIEQECDEGEACLVDRCAPDPDASCDVRSRCLDNKTVARCLGEDRGFEVVECPGETYCEGGQCRGPVCALGSVCNDQNQIVECVDGSTLRNTQCAVNEQCVQQRDEAACLPRPCEPGQFRCGDPLDDSVDAMRFYSQCMPAAQTASGLPQWVVGECTGLLTCDPAMAALGAPCQQECTPGAETCMGGGWAVCRDDGTWGPVELCDAGDGSRLLCVQKPTLDASVLPEHLCAAPVCAYVIENQDAEGGACNGGDLLPCLEDGTLGDPQPCEVGICRATAAEAQADGRIPGACDSELECQEGEERCLADDIFPTPVYQVCESGIWSAALSTCAGDAICLDYEDPDGLQKKVCGADCLPGEKRCNISDQVETCDADGAWGTPETCGTGVCQTLPGAVGEPRDAACILECIPGQAVCSGVQVQASDGVSTGWSQEALCDTEGLLGAPTACAAGETCRVSRAGEHLGCVACLGPDVVGGNESGYMDTRCDPATPANVQECGAANSWLSSRACAGGKSCRVVNGGTCGTCVSGNGLVVTCTESNVSDRQICGPCTPPSTGLQIGICREATLAALATPTTCADEFGDDPANGDTTGVVTWGGFADCCDGMSVGGALGEFLQTTSCESLGRGAPGPWGNEPDCCATAQLAGSGPSFAYCADPL